MNTNETTAPETKKELTACQFAAEDLPVFECLRNGQQIRAEALLEMPPPPGYLQAWSESLAEEQKTAQKLSESQIIFRLENEWLSLPSRYIREVSRPLPIHKIPGKSDNILLGLVNLHGRLQLCFSLKALLGLESMAKSANAGKQIFSDRFIEAEREGFGWIFPADEILDIYQYDLNVVRNVPLTVSNAAANYTKTVFMHQEKMIGCLDDELIISFLKRRIL